MEKLNDISEELQSMGSSLAGMSRKMPYRVPEGYFEGLPEVMAAAIIAGGEETAFWGRSVPYDVPAGYFEQLTGSIVAAARAEDAHSILPAGLPYAAPAGYFESLPGQVLAAAKGADARKPARLISLSGLAGGAWFRFAAAAALVLGIGIGSYRILISGKTNNPEQILASVSGNEIHDYLQGTYRFDIDRVISGTNTTSIDGVDSKDIIQYLDENGWDATE